MIQLLGAAGVLPQEPPHQFRVAFAHGAEPRAARKTLILDLDETLIHSHHAPEFGPPDHCVQVQKGVLGGGCVVLVLINKLCHR